MSRERIVPGVTTPTTAARVLVERYGRRALLVASNRYDAAETEGTARYYERVMSEVERLRRNHRWAVED